MTTDHRSSFVFQPLLCVFNGSSPTPSQLQFADWEAPMKMFRSPRLLVAAGCVAALIAGTVISAQRSAGAMAGAATAFLNSLSPEQRQKAAFPFKSDERLHWNFIP